MRSAPCRFSFTPCDKTSASIGTSRFSRSTASSGIRPTALLHGSPSRPSDKKKPCRLLLRFGVTSTSFRKEDVMVSWAIDRPRPMTGDEKTFFVRLGGNIAAARREHGLTQARLAHELGVSQQTINSF